MADDPNRDILPVKEGSCVDTCRSNIDPRERHFVCKLDRCQLEDRYLRLLYEANDLKKLSNSQEDKIKRLATKLMRVSGNPCACTLALDVCDDKNRITALELENTMLKDKISVLRNQLLSHSIAGRSSSRSRNPLPRPSSGRITCRSENSRTKTPSCQCIVQTGNDDNDARNYLVKIEELERERKEMIQRIAQLEKELATYAVGTQREKVAENVEYIRVWRHMKQLNDKLIVAQTTNESLNAQINDLKKILEERMKNNQEITAALVAEKKRVAEIDEQMLKIKDSQLALREKDEQIRDLINEVKILQQHNNELIHLSSKYGEVEVENVELKKKVSEQFEYQQTLKTAFSSEQANIVALQTQNEQLLGKLQELQKNIDGLTAQFTYFKTQLEKHESSSATQVLIKPIAGEETSQRSERFKDCASQVDKCRSCCETSKSFELERTAKTARECENLLCKSIQTDYCPLINMKKKDQETSAMTPIKERKDKAELKNVQTEIEKEIAAKNPLTPEKMLKLLEEAQINTPLETARIGHKDGAGTIEYTGSLDLNQRHRQVVSLEKLLFGDSNC